MNSQRKPKRLFFLYDSRACGGGNPDDAAVLVACESNWEAKSYKGTYGPMACFSYRENPGGTADDERHEWDYWGA
jgi:hypothetical protein